MVPVPSYTSMEYVAHFGTWHCGLLTRKRTKKYLSAHKKGLHTRYVPNGTLTHTPGVNPTQRSSKNWGGNPISQRHEFEQVTIYCIICQVLSKLQTSSF